MPSLLDRKSTRLNSSHHRISYAVFCLKKKRYAHVASFDEIQENDFNLNIPRYVDTFEEEEPVDLVAVNTNLLKINEELVQQDQTLLSLINDFSESEENQALIESMRQI